MPKIYIYVEGGMVQDCYSDADIEVILVDLDLQGASDERQETMKSLHAEMLNGVDDGTLESVL